jgi:hypothetical protein
MHHNVIVRRDDKSLGVRLEGGDLAPGFHLNSTR